MAFVSTLRNSALIAVLAALSQLGFAEINAASARASVEASLLIEADTGKVLHAENAGTPWYPASLTKLMTAYVTLNAVKNRRITLDSLVTVSARAAAQQPSKIGFKPGIQLTIDNALKMIMVKSANDVSVVLAEGVSGSVEKFAAEMNTISRNLGMTQSNWVNPNGLPAEDQITSARDLAILARALIHDFPEYDMYWNIPAIKFGKKVMRNHNSLIGRYEGADGMKTGFICASGFNLVASATRRGKRLIAVVLGAQSSPYRGAKAAGLLERGFNRGALSWLSPSLGTVESLQPVNAAPPDLRDELCGSHRKRPAAEEADDENSNGADSPLGFMQSSLPPGSNRASALIGPPPAVLNTIVVHAGPAKKPAETQFAATRALLARAASRSAKVATAGKADAVPVAAAAVPASDALKRDPHTAPVPASAPPAPLAPAQTASVQPAAPPAGTFAPPPNRFERSTRALPGATDVGHPSWMSFAPAARAETPPLTATPDAKPAPAAAKPAAVQVVAVPVPRPRPKVAAAKPETKRKPATAAAR